MIYIHEKDGTIYAQGFNGEDCSQLGFEKIDYGDNLYVYRNPNKVLPKLFAWAEADHVLKFSQISFRCCYHSEKGILSKDIQLDDNVVPRFYADSKRLMLPDIYKIQIEYHFAIKAHDRTRAQDLLKQYIDTCEQRRKAYWRQYNKEHALCDLYDLPCNICGENTTCTARNKRLY